MSMNPEHLWQWLCNSAAYISSQTENSPYKHRIITTEDKVKDFVRGDLYQSAYMDWRADEGWQVFYAGEHAMILPINAGTLSTVELHHNVVPFRH